MRADQYMGLNSRARKLLGIGKLVPAGEIRTMRRYTDGSEVDTGWNPLLEPLTKVTATHQFEGAFGSLFELRTYKLVDGKILHETIQAEPWSSGPMYFIALKDENDNWIEESIWLNSDSGSEGLLTNTVEEFFSEEEPVEPLTSEQEQAITDLGPEPEYDTETERTRRGYVEPQGFDHIP